MNPLKNLFKSKTKIPTDATQEVTVVDSWTVTWGVKSGWSGALNHFHKVFIYEDEMKEFKKQLQASANFIKAHIEIDSKKN